MIKLRLHSYLCESDKFTIYFTDNSGALNFINLDLKEVSSLESMFYRARCYIEEAQDDVQEKKDNKK